MLNERNIGAAEDHREGLFLQRYERLLSWALRITNDRAGAEDLVQDAFIQFTRGRTNLDTIANLDAYLRKILHYLHLARLTRRSEQLHRQSVSIADYDSLSIGLRAVDVDTHLQVKEQLLAICRYACIRKETSRAGSVLILRFFHEYSPSEISKLFCGSRHSVDEWQRIARSEMKTYLENPRQLSFIRLNAVPQLNGPQSFCDRHDLMTALRQMIFNSRLGDCLTVDQLRDIYVCEISKKLEPETLAHIVSCRKCFDGANQMLGLPLLAERFEVDEKDHSEPPENGNGSGGSFGDIRKSLTKHLREVLEHKPEQLRVGIDGVFVSSFSVDSGDSELLLTLNPSTQCSFIDVSSEQGVPLLLFEVNSNNESWAEIDLSEGRLLAASLCGNTLSVTYHVTERDKASEREILRLVPLSTGEISNPNEDTFWQKLKTAIKGQFLRPLWLNPASVTLLVAAFLLLAISFTPHRPSSLTARGILDRALVVERQRNSVSARITHRVISFEERHPALDTLISRQRIEVWEDTTNGTRADRIFDDHNRLVAERLLFKNIEQPVFHHSRNLSSPLSIEQIFQVQPTAGAFTTLVGTNANLALEQQYGLYVISYSGSGMTSVGQLLKATLVLSQGDLHPIKQNLLIEREGQIREYQFIEVRFDQIARDEYDPTVFQPTAETRSSHAVSIVAAGADSAASEARSNSVASAELEIEAAYLLDKAKTDRNEQITLLRDKNGTLRIDGVVETSARKNEVLQVFTPLLNNPALVINIKAADSVSTEAPKNSVNWSTLQPTSSVSDRIAVDRELREYLGRTSSGQSHGSDLDRDVNVFASETVNRSYRARFHAVELKQLADRCSKIDMSSISAAAREKLREMIRTHAEAFSREYALLRNKLEPVFHPGIFGSVREDKQMNSDEELRIAAEELYQLARMNNEMIRSAFTISKEGSSAGIDSEQFWRSVIGAQQMARRIAKYETH